MANNSVYSKANETLLSKSRTAFIKSVLQSGKNLILDNVNTSPKHFEEVCSLVKELNINALVEEKKFYIDLETAIERDSKRTGSANVGEQVIKKFFNSLNREHFQNYKEKTYTYTHAVKDVPKEYHLIDQNFDLPKAVICDLDTTLALFNHRSAYEVHKCESDILNPYIYNNLLLHVKDNSKIFFITGRAEEYRNKTQNWLKKHIKFEYELYMKPDDYKLKDFDFKKEIYQNYIKDKYVVMAVYDDRMRVANMYHDLRFTNS